MLTSVLILQPAISDQAIRELAKLARITWRQHYEPIIGAAQVEYMLERFQSEQAIAQHILAGYQYWVATTAGKCCGYMALVPDAATQRAQLSKIYVHPAHLGQGIGHALLSHARDQTRAQGMGILWLTVNRHNTTALAFYQRQGGVIVAEQLQDIGSGFVMDDYLMEFCV